MEKALRDFLEIPYDKLEDMNLQAKAERVAAKDPGKIREARTKYLADEKRIKAVSVCFTDLEGRFHMLDYDKKFLLKSADNLTFDGSSIRGFSRQAESDLRLQVDWPAFYCLPADVFGPGKVLVFGDVCDQDGTPYVADLRARLKGLAAQLRKKDMVAHVANEIEGFIFKGRDAERRYFETGEFEYVSTGGYYHSLPGDTLRRFIDTSAEVQRALGFANEKDHPEVAPSQFEMNYGYSEAVVGADQVQLYKLIARQVAAQMDMTASFLPKPVAGVNGNGCHTNMSVAKKGKNMLLRRQGPGRPVVVRLGLPQPDPGERQRHLPDPELERQLVPPPRPALRGAEPDQGLGQGPRLDDPHPDRQRAHRAHRGALDRARREPVPRDLHAVQDRSRGPARRLRGRGQEAPHALPAGQHLRRDPALQGQQVRAGAAGRGGPREVRRAEAGLGRALRQGARDADQARERSSSTTRSRTSTSGTSSRAFFLSSGGCCAAPLRPPLTPPE